MDLTRIEVIDFLEELGVENVTEATEEEARFSCPFPGHSHGDQNPSAYMNLEHTGWKCHGCKRKGNAVTFLAEHENVTFQQATTWLRQRFGAETADPDSFSIRNWVERFYLAREREQAPADYQVVLDEETNLRFALDWHRAAMADERPGPISYMLEERGFDADILDEFEIGYDDLWNRITIPVRDEEGSLVGFKGRAWDGRKPKYLAIGSEDHGFPPYKKSKVVFGMNRVLDYWRVTEPDVAHLILVEGELNKIAMEAMGFENVGAVSGSDFSPAQALIIRRYVDSLTVFFDTDSAGADGTNLVVESLKDFMPIRVVPDHEGDAADYMANDDADSVRRLLDDAESLVKIQLLSRNGIS